MVDIILLVIAYVMMAAFLAFIIGILLSLSD
ncbi:hypothetical protein LCGC14_2424460 [marine sediment metagenome]|uniref:Uncharacterized protein n=1 Tax=marine sediment metagenome TaxID=412755 RepID=A0A0F9BNR4_9ZZZZ